MTKTLAECGLAVLEIICIGVYVAGVVIGALAFGGVL